MIEKNILWLTDSYKVTHHLQYPRVGNVNKTTKIYSYFESRGGVTDSTCFFGLQIFLKKYLEGKVITQEAIDEAAELFKLHFGTDIYFNRKGWEYILHKYDGKLPVSIKAVPEGTVVGTHNVLMTIENTDPECYWLTNYLETLLVQTWYPIAVTTNSMEIRKIILHALEVSGDPKTIDYKLWDFGVRGSTSPESASIGGCAHLVSSKGTDNLPAVVLAKAIYHEPCAAISIPASEHSTVTAWGKENEWEAARNMLEQYPEDATIAFVIDSWDTIYAVETIFGGSLKGRVLHRNGTLVLRPDSGNPTGMVIQVLNSIWNSFGGYTNAKGYKVLDNHVRIIQGDGIDKKAIKEILDTMIACGWSADNITFGSGGGLLQNFNRDTYNMAFKCSYACVDGKDVLVYKQPKTSSSKNSKKGRMKLTWEQCFKKYVTYTEDDMEFYDEAKDELVEVFRDGNILVDYNFDEIRKRMKEGSNT